MGRQREPRRTQAPDEGEPSPAHERFEFVGDDRGGVTVMRDGHPQSHVNVSDPRLIEFEYVRYFAMVLDTLAPEPPGPLAVTHVGGAGLTLARYVEATRPGSPQIVLEPDAALTDAVRRELPLPRNHRIRVRPEDGARGLAAMKDGVADVIVLDAFADGRVPASLVTPTFAADVSRVLKPGGVFLANLADEPGFSWTSRASATFMQTLPHALVVGAHEVLKGKRFGNVVLAASASPEALDVVAITRAAAKAPLPTGVRHGAELNRLLRSASAFTDADAERSPAPPSVGAWRVR